MFWLLASGKPRCDEITPFGLRLRNLGFLDGLDRLLKAQVVEQVAPAPNPLGQLDELHQGEATAEFVQGTCPVDAVEEETPVPVRGDDNRIPLHGLVRDLRAHAGEMGGVVGLVEDEARKLDDAQIVDSEDHGPLKGALRFVMGEPGLLAGYPSPPERLKRKSRITNPPKKKAAIRAINPTMPSNR